MKTTKQVKSSRRILLPYIEDDINMKPLLAKWGFPKWDGKGVIINARAESINEKPMFKKLLLSNRCIVPASYYFEWKQENNRKEKYKIKRPGSNIYMAGLYNIVADNSRQLSLFNQSMDVYYTIITRNSNDSVSRIHKRMPLIFDAQEMFDWLEGKTISELMKADHELYGELT
jgi:putative SOS response-associated peptidase YedK